MRRRVLHQSEITLWRTVTRDVTPLLVREAMPEAAPSEPPMPARLETAVSPPPSPRRPGVLPPLPGLFDSAIERRIAAGQARIEARLDLHGLTEDEAYGSLCDFVERCAAANIRLGLVVTGKGRMGKGILRRNLPRWFEAPRLRPLVKAVRPAFERHGGEGASYILFAQKERTPLRR